MELNGGERKMTFCERCDTLNAGKKMGTWGKPK